jgi:hypothetical protein
MIACRSVPRWWCCRREAVRAVTGASVSDIADMPNAIDSLSPAII